MSSRDLRRSSVWRTEFRRAALSWRGGLLAVALGTHFAACIANLDRPHRPPPGAFGALAYVGNDYTPLTLLALAAGLFAAFGLVADVGHGRLAYAMVRTAAPRTYLLARVLAPAVGTAFAVTAGCAFAWAYALLRYPLVPMPTPEPNDIVPLPTLFETAPLAADLAFVALLALVTAALTVFAAVVACSGRQLAALLLPPAFLVVGSVLARGPLEGLDPLERGLPVGVGATVASVIYWLILAGVALFAALAFARPTPGRTDA